MSLRITSFVIVGLSISCDSACGGSGGSGVPPAVAEIAEGREVEPFSGFSVPGVTLYRVSLAVPDRSESSIVGVDDATGALVQGADLLRRMGELPPDELAARVFAVLLAKQGAQPLTPEDPHSLASDAEWALVATARVEEGTLVFFGWRGEMSPELVEHRVRLDTFALSTRTAADILVERGETVAVGGGMCEPLQNCGCWRGCARFQLVRLPGRAPGQWQREGTDPPELYVRERNCTTSRGAETCARVCRADSPTADCEDALRMEQEPCEETCLPTEAPYHCELYTDPDRCEQVEHPTRAPDVPRR